jgi:TP901 family phage tail tape measure protein
MADELISKLGFDASDAIKALENMDEKMGALEGHFGSLASAMTAWNTSAASTISVLKELATHANSAASAMGKLNANMNKGGGGAAAAPPPPPPPPPAPKLWLPAGTQEQLDAIKPKIDAIGTGSEAAGKKAGGFAVSLQMLSRIVITQAIVRALSAIRDAFSEAITANMDFVKHISELNSILGEPKESMEAMKKSIASLATTFNFPLGQVVEAEYQAVSAQFTTTTQRADIMTASLKLAKIGVMDLNTATSLITSALNAYSLDSSHATEVAAKFFQTIRDGKIRGEELAASVGKVMPIAHELGASFDELNTAIVQLTVSGIKAPEAATSLRSALVSLVKPSKDLQRELYDLGYTSGEQIIHVNGLVGALNLLRSSTDGSVAAAVKLVPNVRGQNTLFRETGTNAGKAADEIKRMHEASTASMGTAYKIFIDTNAEKVSADLNKLKVWLATELGPQLLELVSKFLAAAGGVDTLTSAITALMGPITTGILFLAGYKAVLIGIEVYAMAAAGAITVMGAAALGATAILAALAMVKFADEKYNAAGQKARTDFEKTRSDQLAKEDAARAEKIAASADADQKTVQSAERAAAKIAQYANAQTETAKTHNKEFVDSLKESMEQLVSAKEKGYHMLVDLAKESEKEIKDSVKRVNKDKSEKEDVEFKFRQKKDETNDELASRKFQQEEKTPDEERREATAKKHVWQDEAEAEKLAREGSKQLSKATSEEDLASAQATLKRSEAYGQMAMSAAEKAHSTSAEASAERTILDIVNQRMAAEKKLQEFKRQQAAEAEAAAAKEKEQAGEIRDLMKQILKESVLTNKAGAPLDDKTRQENMAAMQTHMDQFQEKAFSTGSWDMSAMINFASFRQKMADNMRGALSDTQLTELHAAPGRLRQLNEEITTGIGAINLFVQLAPGLDLKGKTPDEVHQQVNMKLERMRDIRQEVNQEDAKALNLASRIKNVQDSMRGSQSLSTDRGMDALMRSGPVKDMVAKEGGGYAGDFESKVKRVIDDYDKKLAKLRADMAFSAEHPAATSGKDFESLSARVEQFKAHPAATEPKKSALDTDITSLQTILDLYAQMIAAKEKASKGREEAAAGGSWINKMTTANPVTSANDLLTRTQSYNQLMTTTAETTLPNVNKQLDDSVGKMQTLTGLATGLSNLSIGDTSATPQATPPAQASGGMMWSHFDAGGTARGRDTVHAMLSPGEMVMNEQSSRKFGSQLVAMNSGSRPNYHSHGGSVTNVGDINVHVAGGNSASGTGRQIASELRRELRRGSSTLN